MSKLKQALLVAFVAALIGSAAADAAPLSGVLGALVFPSPGTGGNPDFDHEFDAFSSAVGKVPLFTGVFGDNSKGFSNLAGSMHWYTNPTKSDPRFANGKITPVLGLAMAAKEDIGDADAILRRFNQIAAGKFDGQWSGVVDAWKEAGFRRIVVRVGYEMNGHWMAWAVPGDNKVAAWNAAFHRVSTVMKARGAAIGLHVAIAWNPAVVIWEDAATESMYPGDDVVDIISLDIYSSIGWARDWTNWRADGKPAGTAPDLRTWAASTANRQHFWLYPDATMHDPTGTYGRGWGLAKHIAFAKSHKKPVAISETGVGRASGAPDTGIDDEDALPRLLWEQLRDYPYGVDHVLIWSVDEDDFQGNFLADGKTPHPLARAAWRKYFGDGN